MNNGALLECRAALLDALQKVGMRHRPSRQRWATEILKATKGTDLTRLKAFVDDGGVSAMIWSYTEWSLSCCCTLSSCSTVNNFVS